MSTEVATASSSPNWLVRTLSSTLGKKLVMSLTGLLLCGFLLIHLAGNFLLYVSAEAYNHYAHSLHEQEALIKIGEAGLIVLFVAHIYLAISTTRANRAARRRSYAMKRDKDSIPTGPLHPESWMFISGSIVLLFVILHLVDFTFQVRPDLQYEGKSPYDKAVMILENPLSMAVYLVGSLILGAHLLHGVQSSFQTLGINHPKYNRVIRAASMIFAVVIGLGFASFVVWRLIT